MTKTKYIESTIAILEFDKIINLIASYCLSPLAVNDVMSIVNKSLSTPEVIKEYEYLQEWIWIKSHFHESLIHRVEFDLNEWKNKVEIENYYLEIPVVKDIYELIVSYRKFVDKIKSIESPEKITKISNDIIANTESFILEKKIAIILDGDSIKDTASKKLATIRQSLSVVDSKIDSAFDRVKEQYQSNKMLDEITESVRDGKRVLAVKPEYKRKVDGILLDESDGGKVLFFQPTESLYLLNEKYDLLQDEKKEIIKILQEITRIIAVYFSELISFQKFMIHLDILNAKNNFLKEIDGTIPIVSDKFKINNGFHPLLKVKNKKDGIPTIPFDLELGGNKSSMLISGPNAGGKTVCLKTIALLSLMTKYALPICAGENTSVPIYEKVIGDIGDGQSIENELSTYSSRLQLWKYMIENSDKNTLLLFDEMGAGTDPTFGAFIAISVLDKCIEKSSTVIATTHFSEIKEFGFNSEKILDASLMFDEENLSPMYKLVSNQIGSSYTYQIAEKIGLDKALIKKAKSMSNTERLKFENQILKLENQQRELEVKKSELELEQLDLKKQIKKWSKTNNELELLRQKLKYEKLLLNQEFEKTKEKELQKYKTELHKIEKKEIEQKLKQSREMIQNIDESTDEAYKKVHNIAPDVELKVGDNVRYIQTDAVGVIEKIERKNAIVQFGHIRSKVQLTKLILDEEAAVSPTRFKKVLNADKVYTKELDLRGKFVYEAIPMLEEFLDKALVNHAYEVSIIHGRGALKKEIMKTLRTMKQVSKITHPPQNQGGDGVSIVSF